MKTRPKLAQVLSLTGFLAAFLFILGVVGSAYGANDYSYHRNLQAPGVPLPYVEVYICPAPETLKPSGQGDIPGDRESETFHEHVAAGLKRGCFRRALRVPEAPSCRSQLVVRRVMEYIRREYPGMVWGGHACHMAL